MKLSPKKARYISYLLLFTMVFQSFAPYVPIVEVKISEEKNRKKEDVRRKDATATEKNKKVKEIKSLDSNIGLQRGAFTSFGTTYVSDLEEGEIGLLAGKSFDNPEDNVFRVYMEQLPKANQQLYLTYELYGVSDKSGISRSINDRISRGGYIVKTNSQWTQQRELIHSNWIHKGENLIYFTVPENATYGYKIKNLKLEVGNKEAQDKDMIIESYAYKGGDTYIRGFILDNQSEEIKINGEKISLYEGEFETLLSGVVEEVEIERTGKKSKYNTILVTGQQDYKYSVDLNISQKQEFFKKINPQNELHFLGAEIEVTGIDLISDRLFSVQNLRSRDLPALDMGLQNVTAKAKGYRFLPHGEHFTEGAVVKVAYDRAKIPSGYTEQDIRTYYFDLESKHWVALKRDSVDVQNQMIVSRTTHFTDMINGVIQAPESPETAGFTPTMMSDIKVADPLAKVNLISPPSANNRGSAGMGYSFEMPPARNGMSPSLGIQYNSDGGSGWLGEGWDLNIPGISVDTRWGVPRYDNALETETYLMEGSQLVTKGADGKSSIAHRGEKIPRETDRFFFLRKEGGFAKIQRKGNSPTNYTWEVTNRKGTIYTYGGNRGVVKGSFTNAAGQTKEVISEWKLSRVEELHGDWIEYDYELVYEPVKGSLTSQALYLNKVRAGNKGGDAHTIVSLVRGGQKQKQTSSARYGYLTSQNALLAKVEINFEGSKLREYTFEYKTGAFYTDLLNRVIHRDNEGKEFSSNTLNYYNDVQEAGTYYKETENWNTHDDGISGDFINPISRLQTTGDFSDKATALGGSESTSKGASIYVGGGFDGNVITKGNTGGASFSYSYSEAKGLSTLVDINGDGIPDKVYVSLNSMYYRPGDNAGAFGNPIIVKGASQFSTSYTNSYSFGAKGYLGKGVLMGIGGGDKQLSNTKESRYFTDVNGDGLIDLVIGNKVLFNHIEKDGRGNLIPTFTQSSGDTPSPIRGGGVIDDSDTKVDPWEQAELIANNPLQDVVRMWIAPYDGIVNISGTARLLGPEGEYEEDALKKADGVWVKLQHKETQLKREFLGKEQNTSTAIMNVSNLAVKAGERIYFRVQSGEEETSNGDFDQVEWNPSVTYTSLVAGDDANGYTLTYSAETETLTTHDGIITLPEADSYAIKGTFIKPVTSDRITVKVLDENKAVVHKRLFEANETYNGELNIPVSSLQNTDHLQFKMESPTYIAWEKIVWRPVIHYVRTVNMGNGTTQQLEQTQIAGVQSDTTYETLVNSGSSQTIANAGKGKILISLGLKPGLAPEQIKKINGTFEVKVKDISGTFHIGILSVVNGAITKGAIQEIVFPKGKVWVELYTSDADRTGLHNILSTQAIITDTLAVQTRAATSVYRNWDLQNYGPLHRQWGHFSYNSMEGRAKQPIKESLLVLPQSENDPNNDPKIMKFIPLHQDIMTRIYWEGNDPEVFIKGNRMSPSRLGLKDVILDNPLSNLGNAGDNSGNCIIGGGAIGVRQESKNDSSSGLSGVSLGPVSLTLSNATGSGQKLLGFMDLNGDGYPDIVSKNQVQLTNTLGGFDGEIIKAKNGYTGFQNTESNRLSKGLGGNPVHAYSILSAKIKSLTAKNGTSQASEAPKVAAGSESSKDGAMSYQLDLSENKGIEETSDSFVDVNGDGLPDKILKNEEGRVLVRLNLGYAFSSPVDWNIEAIDKGENKDISIGAGLGYDKDKSSWSGGIGLATTKSESNFILLDINGDGLVDKVRVSNSRVYVSFNKGNSFAEEKSWNELERINKSSSTTESINGSFTGGVTILGFKLVINPGINSSKTMNRTLNDLRDVDGDGFLDLVSSDKENALHVKRSTIARTNKLQKISNSIGGSFVLDYARTAATYDHPGGKWTLSSVEMNDGIKDDGTNTKVEYKYSQGKHDRHEREFLGFGKVETLSVDTDKNNEVYRKSIEEYDVSDYYKAGNHLKSTIEDAAGNKYAETLNKYYHYEVRQIGSNNYSITNTELCSDNQSAYTPLKYTQSKIYEGNKEGIIANESHYVYDTTDHQYGELLRYRYSDKGNLGENGNGTYNYETAITYTSNSSKNIYGLPKEVKVNGSDGKLYRHVKAEYDTNYANHLTRISQVINENTEEAVTDITYDKYGNITQKTLPVNTKGERMWYKYRYDRKYAMYLERIDDTYGYTSELENYDYRYGIPLSTKDYNGYYMETVLDNLGRINIIAGPNEMELGLHYTIKFEYSPTARVSEEGEITQPAYAVTSHYDPQHKGNEIETISFVDGFGKALQVKKTGIITETDENGSNPKDKEVLIVSGRNKLDVFGRVIESYYPITEDRENKTVFNKNFDKLTPTKVKYDILDRMLESILPDESTSKTSYSIEAKNLVATITDAMGAEQKTYTNGSGLTMKTEQLSGPDGTITTSFAYDQINQLLVVTDTEDQKTLSTYDMGGRRIQVVHPSAGTVKLTYDVLGNVLSRQTSNLAEEKQSIEYEYEYNRLTKIKYPQNPQNNVNYYYGGKNAKENRIGRLMLIEDATGAQEFKYGTLGEITEVRRTVIIPNQAIATYVTKTKYDSWNRIEQIIYPDEEKVDYTYNTAGLLTGVKGSKAYSYNYVDKIGYDKFEQRNYLKYCNGAETTYTYDPQRRRLTDLQVWTDPSTNGTGQGARRQIMNNKYGYDAVSNVTNVFSMAPPKNGQPDQGSLMAHAYAYDGLYRLTYAVGIYTDLEAGRLGHYGLYMTYDNLHNITTKKQLTMQENVMFEGRLTTGYDLTYTYDKTNKNQLKLIDDANYRTEESKPEEKREEKKAYTYDANGNLVYINTGLKKKDGNISDKTKERKLRWDEENRLRAISDNGYVSNYWYDASGERVVKSSGEGEQVYVNALFAGGTTNTSNFTAYINPYLVVSPNGKYTKHYYIGSERIVSKLGDMESFGADPRRIEYAGAGLPGVEIDWDGKYGKGIQDIKDNYEHFEVPYNGKDNDDYVNGESFCCTNKDSKASPFEAGIGTGNIDYEKMQFYYHSDHLGSSSYITNLDGEVVQHIEYIPFGEVFLEERNNTWNTPYLFNAKELDSETGLYYYGARYYDPKVSVWLSVDPLVEQTMTPYQYVNQNPIRYIDPTGMAGDDWVKKDNKWTWNENITSQQQATDAGYDDYRAPGSIVDNAQINGTSGTDGKTSVYLGHGANDVSFTWPSSTITPFQVGTEWLSGTGPRHRDFTNGDVFTEMLRQHSHIGDARNTIIDNVANGGELSGNSPYQLGGVQGVGLYIKDYSTLLTGGATGNLAVTYLGSYNLEWTAVPNAGNGTISVNFSVGNTSTMQSASRPPVIGYLPGWQNTVGRRINESFQTGWGSKTSQSFNWTETLQIRR